MRRTQGFTLIELLTVLAIVALLVAIVAAAMGPARESARQRVCFSNLHQWALALTAYRADYDGADPALGQPMTYSQLGLPGQGKTLFNFADTYLKSKQVRMCPDYHGAVPANKLWGNYAWIPGDDHSPGPGSPFSALVAARGEQTPINTDDNHNPWTLQTLGQYPRWTQERVIVLRLDGHVDMKFVLLHTLVNYW